jgi:hypothetical protein
MSDSRPCVKVWSLSVFGCAVLALAGAVSVWAAAPSEPAATLDPLASSESMVGDPLAPGKMLLLEQEIASGIRQRGVEYEFLRFCDYFRGRLTATDGAYTGSELTGNCRLKWYQQMYRNPLKAPAEAERFTRELHQAVLDPQVGRGLARVLATAREKLDLPGRKIASSIRVHSPEEALDAVKQALIESQVAFQGFLAPLTKGEINELSTYLYPVLVSQNTIGHTLADRGTGRRLCDLLEKTNRDALHTAAEALAPLADKEFLAMLAKLPEKGDVDVPGVTGRVLRKIETPAGTIIVGGRGKNVYHLDEMPDVAAVIDLGGDDEYIEGSVSLQRPVLVVIDLAGNDYYHGTKPGIQGGAILGVSMLLDLDGDDTYEAKDVAQGSGLFGVGILIDYAGKDSYRGVRRVQGSALGGMGILIDRSGDDHYRAAMWAQGFGGPLGFGLLDDIDGDDHYYAGGMWRDSYPETPGYEGWSQGVGAGIRQVADGGIGVILDGAGDDVYEFDYIAHGGGYWCGMGFARDFAGNDKYLGSTEQEYYGGPRTQPPYQRFGCGFGCHYALGFMFDDGGDDYYRGTIMGLGFGWDCSVGVLCDFGGNDTYEGTGSSTEGQGAQSSLGILFDYDGDDNYIGYGQGYANPVISYHSLPECGGNFSFLIDYGGNDKYGCGAQNNTYIQRGAAGGFVIDRPRRETTAENPKAPAGIRAASGP